MTIRPSSKFLHGLAALFCIFLLIAAAATMFWVVASKPLNLIAQIQSHQSRNTMLEARLNAEMQKSISAMSELPWAQDISGLHEFHNNGSPDDILKALHYITPAARFETSPKHTAVSETLQRNTTKIIMTGSAEELSSSIYALSTLPVVIDRMDIQQDTGQQILQMSIHFQSWSAREPSAQQEKTDA